MDNTSGPIDLNALGFIGGPVPYATPGINSTYPNQNPAPQIANTTSADSPGFFGTLLKRVEDAGSAVITDVEAAPGAAYDAGKNAASNIVGGVESGVGSVYSGIKNVVSTVGSDVGGGLNNLLSGAENHIFLIFGVAVVGLALVLWSAGKSGAVHANVTALV